MIGLTIVTHIVYWYRGWKTRGLSELERIQLLENELKQMDEFDSPDLSLPDYLPPYDQPRTERENNHGAQVPRLIQERPERNPNDDRLAANPQRHLDNMSDSYQSISNSISTAHHRMVPWDLATLERSLIE